jgi:DNA repair exonuclease SbcCD nuclease subunit
VSKIGLISDTHLGFARYSKVNERGVNVREADFYSAFVTGMENLANAGVDAIVHLGDIADTPSPKKRALRVMVDTINATGLPVYAACGNHEMVRRATDIHLYSYLAAYCPNFHGYTQPEHVDALGATLIPYGSADEIRAGLQLACERDAAWIGGHFACNDVLPQGHDIATSELPDMPVFLGHFHGRTLDEEREHLLAYVGATERKAWGEARNPTGVAMLDGVDEGIYTLYFIDHQARPYIDLDATHENYLDVLDLDLEGAMVRLTVDCTPEQYRSLHVNEARQRASAALDFSYRRLTAGEKQERQQGASVLSLTSAWREHVREAKLPKGVQRKHVQEHGEHALSAAGVAA